MAHSQYDTFLSEATSCDTEFEVTLDKDPLYGLYTSWCHINQRPIRNETAFWAAMKDRIRPERNGLRMKGPAAADYILTSYPGLV
ncbi:hypothetical protein [Arthrobacter sp. HMWF013]|uniref:hypothetical protein n=1 Tax=Arthrobacter sp. HMWF013 TaxID=2056849 RepID=UPI000D3794AF|nr:hypothetical protein [Arthrobacter sp. HMWF013]PTT68349.1 hypothetical protein DBR22_06770 [Arthrobacter sp. HMWF013]